VMFVEAERTHALHARMIVSQPPANLVARMPLCVFRYHAVLLVLALVLWSVESSAGASYRVLVDSTQLARQGRVRMPTIGLSVSGGVVSRRFK
jgi:hypothetical protein